MKTEPYTIQRARIEYEQYGVVSVPDADDHTVTVYETDEDALPETGPNNYGYIIMLPYSGNFYEDIPDRRVQC